MPSFEVGASTGPERCFKKPVSKNKSMPHGALHGKDLVDLHKTTGVDSFHGPVLDVD